MFTLSLKGDTAHVPQISCGSPNPWGVFLLICSWFFEGLGPGYPSRGSGTQQFLEMGSGLISTELQRDRSRSHRRRRGRSPAGSQLQGSSRTRPGLRGVAGKRSGDRSRRPSRDPVGIPEQALNGLNEPGQVTTESPPRKGSLNPVHMPTDDTQRSSRFCQKTLKGESHVRL